MKHLALALGIVLAAAPALAEETAVAPAADVGKSAAPAPVQVGSGGAPVDAKGGAQLGGIGGSTTAHANAVAGSARSVAAPKVDAAPAPVVGKPTRRRAAATRVPDAPAVIAGMGPRLRACLGDADAGVDGPAVLSATIASSGEVTEATVLTPGGVSAPAVACFRAVFLRARFAPLGPAGAVLQLRVSPRQLPPVAPNERVVLRR